MKCPQHTIFVKIVVFIYIKYVNNFDTLNLVCYYIHYIGRFYMENNDDNILTREEYYDIENMAISGRLGTDDLIELHKRLIGKKDKRNLVNYAIDLIKTLLYGGYCRSFIESDYMSDYFKDGIKEIINPVDFSREATILINSDKSFRDMSGEELRIINNSVNSYYERKTNDMVSNISIYFQDYLCNLREYGVKWLIANDLGLRKHFAKHILNMFGLKDEESWYSKRGVNTVDLNSATLGNIFHQLSKYNYKWSTEFVELVKNMELLGARDFVPTFLDFAKAGFDSEVEINIDSNVNGNYLDNQRRLSQEIKDTFIMREAPTILNLKPDFTYENGCLNEFKRHR